MCKMIRASVYVVIRLDEGEINSIWGSYEQARAAIGIETGGIYEYWFEVEREIDLPGARASYNLLETWGNDVMFEYETGEDEYHTVTGHRC